MRQITKIVFNAHMVSIFYKKETRLADGGRRMAIQVQHFDHRALKGLIDMNKLKELLK